MWDVVGTTSLRRCEDVSFNTRRTDQFQTYWRRPWHVVCLLGVSYFWALMSFQMFIWNQLSKDVVSGKHQRSGGHRKRNCLQDRADFHRSRAWQIVLTFDNDTIHDIKFRVRIQGFKQVYTKHCINTIATVVCQSSYRPTSSISRTKSQKLKCFFVSSCSCLRLYSIEVRC